jgi:hypothetical protein
VDDATGGALARDTTCPSGGVTPDTVPPLLSVPVGRCLTGAAPLGREVGARGPRRCRATFPPAGVAPLAGASAGGAARGALRQPSSFHVERLLARRTGCSPLTAGSMAFHVEHRVSPRSARGRTRSAQVPTRRPWTRPSPRSRRETVPPDVRARRDPGDPFVAPSPAVPASSGWARSVACGCRGRSGRLPDEPRSSSRGLVDRPPRRGYPQRLMETDPRARITPSAVPGQTGGRSPHRVPTGTGAMTEGGGRDPHLRGPVPATVPRSAARATRNRALSAHSRPVRRPGGGWSTQPLPTNSVLSASERIAPGQRRFPSW